MRVPPSWMRRWRVTGVITLATAGVVAFGADLAVCLTSSNVIYDDSGLRATFSHEPGACWTACSVGPWISFGDSSSGPSEKHSWQVGGSEIVPSSNGPSRPVSKAYLPHDPDELLLLPRALSA